MALNTYRDLSTGTMDLNAGFQFEFTCARCSARWRSPFRPHRMGQASNLIMRFSFLFDSLWRVARTSGNFNDIGARGAKESALAEAQAEASTRFVECGHCHRVVCKDCHDDRRGACLDCLASASAHGGAAPAHGEARAAGAGCPNCGSPSDGGRFCPECGFDMASTHKSCPGCGTMVARSSRFCTDCGHAF